MRRHLGFVLAAMAVLMASIDGTITVVALPQFTNPPRRLQDARVRPSES